MEKRIRRTFTDAIVAKVAEKYQNISSEVDYNPAMEKLHEALLELEEIYLAIKVNVREKKKNFKTLSKFSEEEIEAFLKKLKEEKQEEQVEQKEKPQEKQTTNKQKSKKK